MNLHLVEKNAELCAFFRYFVLRSTERVLNFASSKRENPAEKERLRDSRRRIKPLLITSNYKQR